MSQAFTIYERVRDDIDSLTSNFTKAERQEFLELLEGDVEMRQEIVEELED